MAKIKWVYECAEFMPHDCGDIDDDVFDYVPRCPKCNKQLDLLHSAFCDKCGEKLEHTEKPSDYKRMTRLQMQNYRYALQKELKCIDRLLSCK